MANSSAYEERDGRRPGLVSAPQGWAKACVVYVVQEDSSKNMTSALDFGSCEALLSQREEATMLNIPSIITKLKFGLAKFTTHDCLLLSGNPVSIGIACAIVAELTGGEFNVLKWDGQERRYWKARVNLRQVAA